MKRIIGKLISSLVCFGLAYLYWFMSKDVPWFYTIGTAFRCMIPVMVFGAIMFLVELVTGKDIPAS